MIGEATRAAPPSTNAGFKKCEAIHVSIAVIFQPRNTRNTRKLRTVQRSVFVFFVFFVVAIPSVVSSELLPAGLLHADPVVEVVSEDGVDVFAGSDGLVVDPAS